jgi:hypothetical protein
VSRLLLIIVQCSCFQSLCTWESSLLPAEHRQRLGADRTRAACPKASRRLQFDEQHL